MMFRRFSPLPAHTWVVIAGLTLFLASCGVIDDLQSPVSVTDRPLSEQLEDRVTVTSVDDQLDEVSDSPSNSAQPDVPEAIAFASDLVDGDFLRLVVVTNGVDTVLRAGPGSAYEALAPLRHGVEVLATGSQTGEWVHVVFGDFEGWVNNRRVSMGDVAPRDAVIAADEVETKTVVYRVYGATIGVNIRAEANAQADLVTGAPVGTEVVGTGRTDGSWIEVTFNGVTGWASGNYLNPVGSLEDSEPEPEPSADAAGSD